MPADLFGVPSLDMADIDLDTILNDGDDAFNIDSNFFDRYVDELQHQAGNQYPMDAANDALGLQIGGSGSNASSHEGEDMHDMKVFTKSEASGSVDEAQTTRTSGGVNKPKRRRVRTIEQQEHNKIAQQRYRERRKQKYEEMEKAVDALNAQISSLTGVANENEHLRSRNSELERMVQEQNAQLERMHQQMQDLMLQLDKLDVSSPHTEHTEEHSGPPPTAQIQNLQQQYSAAIKKLQDLIAANQLDPSVYVVGAHASSSSSSVSELGALIYSCCAISVKLVKANVPCAQESVSKCSVENFSKVKCQYMKQKFAAALEQLHLSSEQREAILSARASVLAQLQSLYEERQKLNMVAMGLMLPRPGGRTIGCTDPSSFRLDNMEVNGYTLTMGTDQQLPAVLDSIKDNLRREQKMVLEFNYSFLHQLLHPVQAAVLMVAMYPATVDALAIANTLQSTASRTSSSSHSSGDLSVKAEVVANVVELNHGTESCFYPPAAAVCSAPGAVACCVP